MSCGALINESHRRALLGTLVPIAQQGREWDRIADIFGVRESRQPGKGVSAEIVRTEAGRRDGAENKRVCTEIIAPRAFVLLQKALSDQGGKQPAHRRLAEPGVCDKIGQSRAAIAVRSDFSQQSNSAFEALRAGRCFADGLSLGIRLSPLRYARTADSQSKMVHIVDR